MRILTFLMLCVVSGSVFSQSVNCEGAPEKAVTELPAPINQWAVVYCSPAGHAIAPIDGYLWMGPNGRPFMFQSAALLNAPELKNRHAAHYTTVLHRKLSGQAKYGTNIMLAKAGGPSDQSLQPWQLDVHSNKGILYNLFFYEKEGAVSHVLGCINRCNTSVLLSNSSLKNLQKKIEEK